KFGVKQEFAAGTNPAGVTIQQLNDDNHDGTIDARDLPDLVVANEGSNDVTILLGQEQDGSWTLTPGPRLKLFDPKSQQPGLGPVSTPVQDLTGDRTPDLLVTNSQSNDVFLIPGVGDGFFDDRNPQRFATGVAPQESFVGEFDGNPGPDLVTINAG